MGPPPPIPPPARAPKENPLDRIPEHKRHRYERIKLAVREKIEHRIELFRAWIRIDGRVQGTVELSDEEKIERFWDFQARKKLIESMKTNPNAGPEQVRAYLEEMETLALREAGRGTGLE